MNLLTDNIKTVYFRYFWMAFGGCFISSIYSAVDMAFIGQYHGPDGSAALAVVMPVYSLVFSLGLLVGIGGSVLYSAQKGKGLTDSHEHDEYYTLSMILGAILSVIVFIVLWIFEEELLTFFGADSELMPLAKKYMEPIRIASPVFLLSQIVSSFLRNDNDPGLATKAVCISSVFNIFADYFLVFVVDLGIQGAGIATAIGVTLEMVIMLTHFASKKNTLKIVHVSHFAEKTIWIVKSGFSSFFTDFSIGIVTILFNQQIMRYFGSDALSVYGILANLNTFVVCCGYSVGQASQPIFSMNYGAGKWDRISETMKYALGTSVVFGIFWTALVIAFPNAVMRVFMSPTPEVLAIAPGITRVYGWAYFLIPFNVFATYYFQAIMKPAAAFGVSVFRGLILSGIFVLVLPYVFGADAIWLAMPLTELITAAGVAVVMVKYTKNRK